MGVETVRKRHPGAPKKHKVKFYRQRLERLPFISSASEIAEVLGIHYTAILGWVKTGKLAFKRKKVAQGSPIFIYRNDMIKFLAQTGRCAKWIGEQYDVQQE
jgi:hypothetical protein